MYPVFLLTLSGCWSNYWWKGYDEMNTLDPTEVPYQVDGLTATDAVVTGFTRARLITCSTPTPTSRSRETTTTWTAA